MELYRRHFDPVYDFAFWILRDADEAADVAQETFVSAMKALKPGGQEAAFRTWVFTIARNLSISRIRKGRRVSPIVDPDAGDTESGVPVLHLVDERRLGDPDAAARSADLARLVWEAAAFLNPRESSILDLHLRQGLDSGEIAEVLGVSKGNAYTILSRLKSTFEESVVALVMIRHARVKCEALERMLSKQSGALISVEVRRAVTRHVANCSVCSEERRKLLSPAALFGAFAMVPLPAGLKVGLGEAIKAQWHIGAPPVAGQAASPIMHGVSRVVEVSSAPPRNALDWAGRQVNNVTRSWRYQTRLWRAGHILGGAGLAGLAAIAVVLLSGGEATSGVGVASTPTPTANVSLRTSTATPTPTPSSTPTPTSTPTPSSSSPVTGQVDPVTQPPGSLTPTPLPRVCTDLAAGFGTFQAELTGKMVDRTNDLRGRNGFSGLREQGLLTAVAQQHARFVLQQFTEDSPWWAEHKSGEPIHEDENRCNQQDRATYLGYDKEVAENIGWVSLQGYSGQDIEDRIWCSIVGDRDGTLCCDSGLGEGYCAKDRENPAGDEMRDLGLACGSAAGSGGRTHYVCVQVMGVLE